MDRRTLIAAGLAAGIARPALAQMPPAPAPAERLPVWPGRPPGGEGRQVEDVFVRRSPTGGPDDIAWTHVGAPWLKVTAAAKPDGRAVLLLPGGGYARVASGRAPWAVARMFADAGVSAFELIYRLPHDNWAAGPDAPLQDAQRALRLIRHHAARWRIDPAKVMAMGFSAGGHLVGRLGEMASRPSYAAIDAVDTQSVRPVAIGMFFPVVTMTGADTHAQSKRELLGPEPTAAQADAWSLERHVPADMPPTFVAHAADDRTVPYTNSIAMFAGLQAAKIPSEMMIAESGGHGIPLLAKDGSPLVWLQQVQAFGARHGWAA